MAPCQRCHAYVFAVVMVMLRLILDTICMRRVTLQGTFLTHSIGLSQNKLLRRYTEQKCLILEKYYICMNGMFDTPSIIIYFSGMEKRIGEIYKNERHDTNCVSGTDHFDVR